VSAAIGAFLLGIALYWVGGGNIAERSPKLGLAVSLSLVFALLIYVMVPGK